ncbi:GNAT family N-acetyltransferase [Streptomyces sp.]|uniref:GNAT family N-acetyltransferase n=1 Tax=Streptomyces sp. TaxID=1931 RepID=UPI002D76F7CA|nr:GNAT family N-acetyltransferase [Streptomyces sp.]HET6353208.1 GNAT family N-acetyltransferase [Streptomyces sp.]
MAAEIDIAPLASPRTGSGLTARRLHDGEVDAALRLCPFEGVDADVIRRELAAEADYCWMGLFTPDGTPAAVHRAMRWHRHLLLKGVFVDDEFRGSGAALGVAFAIRDWAREVGYEGVVAWVEPNKPEARLATRLRLRPVGPLLHRYLVQLPYGSDAERPTGAPPRTSGTLVVPGRDEAAPMVRELLGVPRSPSAGTRLAWVLDRSRLVLSGNPCRSMGDLDGFLAAVKDTAVSAGATAAEMVVEAADIPAALAMVGLGARRLSRSPVALGMVSFAGAEPSGTSVHPAATELRTP